MKLDSSRYRSCIPAIKYMLETKDLTDLAKAISEMSVSTFVPIVAVYMYVEEILGQSEELTKNKERLINFYHYTEVK